MEAMIWQVYEDCGLPDMSGQPKLSVAPAESALRTKRKGHSWRGVSEARPGSPASLKMPDITADAALLGSVPDACTAKLPAPEVRLPASASTDDACLPTGPTRFSVVLKGTSPTVINLVVFAMFGSPVSSFRKWALVAAVPAAQFWKCPFSRLPTGSLSLAPVLTVRAFVSTHLAHKCVRAAKDRIPWVPKFPKKGAPTLTPMVPKPKAGTS